VTAFESLDPRLVSADLDERLAACWEVFDLGMRLADAAAWQNGVDAAAALAVGAACASGRELMPLPAWGAPIALHDVVEEATAGALERVAVVLGEAARESDDVNAVGTWHVAAQHAGDAARCLRALRAA
jgi:hypothetical protein